MKPYFIPFLRVWVLGISITFGHSDLFAGEEEDLIAVLQSNAGAPVKADACVRLRLIGSARSVPAIAGLLGDERLSQAARHALEELPVVEATTALRGALGTTTGANRLGIIDSLGWRRDPEAVPALTRLLTDGESTVAIAAANALTRIGGDDVRAALQSAKDKVSAPVRAAVINGLLAAAGRLLEEGRGPEAMALYQTLTDATEDETVRVAAFSGRLRAAGDDGLSAILEGLETNADSALRSAALQAAVLVRPPGITTALADLLGKATPTDQAVLVPLLRRLGDPAAAPAVMKVARDGASEVRVDALATLGELGDASAVPLLLEAATRSDGLIQATARGALVNLRRGQVTSVMLASLNAASAETRREVFRALGARGDHAAVGPLMTLVAQPLPELVPGALQALGHLVGAGDLPALVDLLTAARDEDTRRGIVSVFESMVERSGPDAPVDIDPILRVLSNGSRDARVALFPVGMLLSDPRLRPAYRVALRDADDGIRAAAARALCDTRDAGFLPDLLEIARGTTNTTLRSLSIEGFVRLVAEESSALSLPQRVEALSDLCKMRLDAADRRRVLSGLSKVADLRTYELARNLGADAEVQSHAEFARVQIAGGLRSNDFERVESELRQLASQAKDPSVRTNAQSVLQRWDSGWVGAGPYRVPGKPASELFDVTFPPEKADAKDLAWHRVPGSADPARPGEVDLGEFAGGDHAVVYVKTQLHVDSDQDARFAIGSDDGIKLWLNGALIHANNAVRGLTPGQDQATGRLKAGWNDLLAKVTQHTAGCGLSMRVTRPDGAPLPGLRLSAAGAAK
ncbi:MAG: HEAT repeat domain-containing protein [Verrucomicrobiales bacterium]|nr:HEAT repeat domain-containing protein [Verrucomicrobiales bacterium]